MTVDDWNKATQAIHLTLRNQEKYHAEEAERLRKYRDPSQHIHEERCAHSTASKILLSLAVAFGSAALPTKDHTDVGSS